jgi:hypothetical protein
MDAVQNVINTMNKSNISSVKKLQDLEIIILKRQLTPNLDHNNPDLIHDMNDEMFNHVCKMLYTLDEGNIKLAREIVFKSKITEEQLNTFIKLYRLQLLHEDGFIFFDIFNPTQTNISLHFEMTNKRLNLIKKYLTKQEIYDFLKSEIKPINYETYSTTY